MCKGRELGLPCCWSVVCVDQSLKLEIAGLGIVVFHPRASRTTGLRRSRHAFRKRKSGHRISNTTVQEWRPSCSAVHRDELELTGQRASESELIDVILGSSLASNLKATATNPNAELAAGICLERRPARQRNSTLCAGAWVRRSLKHINWSRTPNGPSALRCGST
jgi:hypothetical protein